MKYIFYSVCIRVINFYDPLCTFGKKQTFVISSTSIRCHKTARITYKFFEQNGSRQNYFSKRVIGLLSTIAYIALVSHVTTRQDPEVQCFVDWLPF